MTGAIVKVRPWVVKVCAGAVTVCAEAVSTTDGATIVNPELGSAVRVCEAAGMAIVTAGTVNS